MGLGFIAGLVASLLVAVVAFMIVRTAYPSVPLRGSRLSLVLQMGGWAMGAFLGALLAQRLGARLSHTTASLFGLFLAAVDGLMFLAAPPSYLMTAALAAAAAAMLGAAIARRTASSVEPMDRQRTPTTASEAAPAQPITLLDLAKEEARRRRSGEPPLPLPPKCPPSFAERTGQVRRFLVARGVVIVGGATILAGWLLRGPNGNWLELAGAAVAVIGFVAQSLSVRCPRCGVAVVWHTFTTRKASEAGLAARFQRTCPKCGYDPP